MQRSAIGISLALGWLAAVPLLGAQTPAPSIRIGERVSGTITASDPKLEDGSHYDSWRLRGQANQRVEIVMESADFDAFLKLAEGTAPEPIETDDDGAGGTNARVIATLQDRDYVISANTLGADQKGSYTLRVTALPPPAPPRPPAPMTGNLVNGRLDSSDPLADDESHYDDYRYVAQAREGVTIDLTSTDFDAYLEVGRMRDGEFESLKSNDDSEAAGGSNARLEYTFPTAGEYVIRANSLSAGETGAYTLRLTSVGVRPEQPRVAARPLRGGETVTGALADTDPEAEDETYYDEYSYTGAAGERLLIDMASPTFDTYLIIGQFADGEFKRLAENDDSSDPGTNSTLVYTLPSAGEYVIRANSVEKATGAYTLTIRSLGR